MFPIHLTWNDVTERYHRIKLHFKDAKGTLIKTVEGNEGDDILSLAHEHDIDLEGTCSFDISSKLSDILLPVTLYRCLRGLCCMFDMSCHSFRRSLRHFART